MGLVVFFRVSVMLMVFALVRLREVLGPRALGLQAARFPVAGSRN